MATTIPIAGTTRYTETPIETWKKHLQLDSSDYGNIIIASDFHAPCHSIQWCNRMLDVSRKTKADTLIIVGDGFDMSAFSNWGADPDCSWDRESALAAEWLWITYNHFKRIIWPIGNHELRATRATNGQLPAKQLIDAILVRYARDAGHKLNFDPDKLVLSSYPFCFLDDEWMLVHPGSYSRVPLRVANSIALNYGKSVMAGHAHRAARGYSDNRQYQLIDLGGMFDENKIRYKAMRITTHPNWNNAFVFYSGGYVHLLDESTNWERWGTI